MPLLCVSSTRVVDFPVETDDSHQVGVPLEVEERGKADRRLVQLLAEVDVEDAGPVSTAA